MPIVSKDILHVTVDNHLSFSIATDTTTKTSIIKTSFHSKGEGVRCNSAIHAVESLILAQFNEGIDVTSNEYKKSLLVTLEAIENNLG